MYFYYILVTFLTEWLTGTQLTLYFVEANSQGLMDPGDGIKTTTVDDIARETTRSPYEWPSGERSRTTQSQFKLPAEVFGEAGLKAFCRTLIMVHTTSTSSTPPSTTPQLPSSEQQRSTEDWSFGEDIRQRASSTAKPPEAETKTNQTIISTSPKLLQTTITGITSSTPYPSTPSAPPTPTTTPFNIPTEPQTIPVIKSTSPKLTETTIIQSTTPYLPTPSKTPISTPGPPPKISGETITNQEISTSPNLPENIIFQTTTPNHSTLSMTHTTTPGRPPKVSDDTVKNSVRISTSPKLLETTTKTTTSYPPTPHITPKSTLSNILMTTYRSRNPQSSEHIPLVTETTGYTHNSEYTTPIKDEPPQTKSSHTTFRQTPFTNTNTNIMVTEEDFINDGSTIVDIPKRGTSTTKENNKTIDQDTSPSAITTSKASFSTDYNTTFKTSSFAIHQNTETTRMGVTSFAETSQTPTNTNPSSTPTKTSTHASSITENMQTTTMSVLHYTSMTKWLQTQSNTYSTPTSIKTTSWIPDHTSYVITSRPVTSTVKSSDMPHLQSTDQSEIVNVQSTFSTSASHTLSTTTKPKLRNETLLSTTLKMYETSRTNSNSAIKTITTTPVASQITELVVPSRKTKSTNNGSTPSKYVATTELKTKPTTEFHHNKVTTENIKSTQVGEAQTTLTNIESTPIYHTSMNNEPLPTHTHTRQSVSSTPPARTFTTLTETTPTLYTETKTTEMLIQPTFSNTPIVNKNESSTVSGTSFKSNTPKHETFSTNIFRPQPTSTSSILPTKRANSSTTVSLTETTSSYILPTIVDHTITRQTKMTSTQHIASTIVKSTYHDTLTHKSTTTLKSTSTQTNGESQQHTSRSSSTGFKPSVTTDADGVTSPSVADMFTPPIHWSFSTPLIGGPNDPDLYDPLVRQALFEMYCQESTSIPYVPSPTKSDFINSVTSSHSQTMSTRILLVWILWFYG